MSQSSLNIIERLRLAPHPEGGYYRRIYESTTRSGERPVLTGIAFLLEQGQASRWHRVDGDECWHWQQGGELELLTWDENQARLLVRRLGAFGSGAESMLVVPAGVWQAARAVHAHTLVACTVSPGFIWEGFEMLAEDAALADVLRDLGAWVG